MSNGTQSLICVQNNIYTACIYEYTIRLGNYLGRRTDFKHIINQGKVSRMIELVDFGPLNIKRINEIK